jgi:hypothetical protein
MKKLLPALLTVGFAASAIAQGLPAFEEVDANGDGVISAEEASAVEGLDIATADTNQDGVIDPAEYGELE